MGGLTPFSEWSAASPYALALGLIALMGVVLAGVGWQRRDQPGAIQFACAMAGAAIWALFYAFELTAPSLAGKLFWAKAEYIGISLVPLAWFLFGRSYTGAIRKLDRRLVAAASLIPAVTVMLAATNGSHYLLWSDVFLSGSGSFPNLVLSHGPWFWVHVVYTYGLLAAGSVLLLRTAYHYPQPHRRQAALFLVATAMPWVGSCLSIFVLLPRGSVDITPVTFALAGVVLLVAVSRLRLFASLPVLLPIVRSQVLEKMADGVLVLDVGGRVVTCNPAARAMLASADDEFLGRPASEILGDAVPNPALAPGDDDRRFEIAPVLGGIKRHFDVMASPLGLRGGEVGALLVLRDITERKKNEESLRLTQLALDRASDLIQWVAPDGRILYASESSCRRFDYKPEEMLQKTIYELDPAMTPAEWPRHWRRLREQGSLTFESRHRTRDGEVFPVEVSANHMESGGQEFALGFARDITERKRVEVALSESEERFRRMFEYMSSGVAVYEAVDGGADFRIAEFNPAAEAATRVDRAAVLDQRVSNVFPRIEEFGLLEVLRRVWTTGLPERYPTGLYQDERLTFWAENYVYRLPSGEVVAIFDDATERKQAEEALQAAEEQLRQSQKMEAVGRLAGGIAHDFNNLLTAIIGNSTLALAGMPAEEPTRELIADVKEVGERAAGLTRQILAFSRRQILKPQTVCLNDIVAGMELLLGRTLGEDVELHLVLAPDLVQTEVDPHQMEQVLMNLAVNARDAMPDGGSLTIQTAGVRLDRAFCRTHPGVKPGRYVVLTVADTGCGMDEQTRSRSFEPFFTTKEVGKGTGLGLSIVFGIVKQSGGTISVHSEPGSGSTFRVYLPASRTGSREGALPAKPRAAGGTETVLVIEDEVPVRGLVARVLRSSGYTVLEAGSAAEVDAVLAEWGRTPDLVLTDMVLPGGMNGRQVAQALTARRPDLPVVYMSAYRLDSVIRDSRLDQGIDFLEKPFAPEALLAKIRGALDAGAGISGCRSDCRYPLESA